jgi:hypothetical protein
MVFPKVVESQRARERALCRIDHRALRLAGRELLRRAAAGELKPDVYYRIRSKPRSPESLQFPKVLLELAPESIYIEEEGYLRIEMCGGGGDNCEILVYPEGFVEPYPAFKFGHRKLLDGLWYCDNEYDFDPEYGKTIDAMIKRGVNRGTH